MEAMRVMAQGRVREVCFLLRRGDEGGKCV